MENRITREMEKRIEKAVDDAEDAFWEVIATNFPEAKTGDLDPFAHVNFVLQGEDVVKTWLAMNTDLLPNYWGDEGEEGEE